VQWFGDNGEDVVRVMTIVFKARSSGDHVSLLPSDFCSQSKKVILPTSLVILAAAHAA